MPYRPPNIDDFTTAATRLRNILKDWPADRAIVVNEILPKLGFRTNDRSAEMYVAAYLRQQGFERVKKRVDGIPRMVWKRR